jgi:hypothetical protein
VISSKPWIPVAVFSSVLEDGCLAFFFWTICFVFPPGGLRRVGSGSVMVPSRGSLSPKEPPGPFTIDCFYRRAALNVTRIRAIG